MALNVDYLLRTADTLEQALFAIQEYGQRDDVRFDLYRNAAIKSFELSLETAGKLLRKALKTYGASARNIDALVFNDVLRHAGQHSLLDVQGVERWLSYRANRNNTAHDYGEGFANKTLARPAYLADVRSLLIRHAIVWIVGQALARQVGLKSDLRSRLIRTESIAPKIQAVFDAAA